MFACVCCGLVMALRETKGEIDNFLRSEFQRSEFKSDLNVCGKCINQLKASHWTTKYT